MAEIDFVLFDAANTLIHKPDLWKNMQHVLIGHGYQIHDDTLQYHHKLISELFFFPDRTTAEFYKKFNSELLYSLGIVPNDKLLDEMFAACTYLPWQAFDDTTALSKLGLPIGILSNFKSTLKDTIEPLFGPVFDMIITSEELSSAKPQISFYREALQRIGMPAEKILYVGDSVKLDMEPAGQLGMVPFLIDRQGIFRYYPRRIASLHDLTGIVNSISEYQ